MENRPVGFFADVHSNPAAFRAMIEVIEKRQDLTWYYGGDTVGWFFQPVECVLMLMGLMRDGLVKGGVLGNHCLMALGEFQDDPAMSDRMKATAFSAGALLQDTEARRFLESMRHQHTIVGDSWVVAHHSPFGLPSDGTPLTKDHFRYLNQDMPDHLVNWTNSRWPVLLTGHDHVAKVHYIQAGLPNPTLDDVKTIEPLKEQNIAFVIPIESGLNYWVQTGAAGGPPRDGVMAINWVEYYPDERIVLRRAPYDTRELERDIINHHYLMTHGDTWQKVLQLIREQR